VLADAFLGRSDIAEFGVCFAVFLFLPGNSAGQFQWKQRTWAGFLLYREEDLGNRDMCDPNYERLGGGLLLGLRFWHGGVSHRPVIRATGAGFQTVLTTHNDHYLKTATVLIFSGSFSFFED